jgi:hypothetical protein
MGTRKVKTEKWKGRRDTRKKARKERRKERRENKIK